MKKRNKDSKIKFAYYYSLDDRTTMREEAIKKRIERFRKLYIDTAKHEQDITKWINAGTRKKGDIRRSLEGLENKYQELADINNDFKRKGIYDIKAFKDSINEEQYNLIELKNRTKELYSLAGLDQKEVNKNNVQSIYGKEIELVTDIPSNKRSSIVVKEKENVKDYKEKKKIIDFKKLGRRVASFAMAIIMTTFAGVRAGNNGNRQNVDMNNKNLHVDTNRDNKKEEFRERIYVEAAESVKRETVTKKAATPTIKSQIINKNKSISNKQDNKKPIIDDDCEYYIAKADIKYTESSDGSGAFGYFLDNTKVRVYNRALVKIDKNGNKKILEATKPGQTWREYAEEKGLNFEEFRNYMNNNKNIQKCVSLESFDGENDFGWVSESELQEIERTGEKER